MREFEIKPDLQKTLVKLFKKDRNTYEAVMNKISEVVESSDPEHYKNLKYNFKELKRVHIGHFVLVFNYDKEKDLLTFMDYDHHDNIYKR
ncbi:MAG: type II toxin-antitoxin system mRNA interferase toxin, RelE/StbE family [Nanoarchaeota archaeon]|nr:type II toxin-antitoxin system mRNA interferase toxin, RelE/StbE family [Nanoarchaeota archaeon]